MINLELHKQKEIKIVKIYAAIKVLTVLMAILAIFFVSHILKKERSSAEKYLEQSVLQTASNLGGRVNSTINELNVLSAKLAGKTNNYSEQEVLEFLSKHIADYNFHRLVFAYPDGHTIRIQKNSGLLKPTNWANDERFLKAISGTSVFIETKMIEQDPLRYVNEFGVPVYGKDGKIRGVLGAQVYADKYVKILGYNNYNKQGFSYIIDSDGNFIIKPPRDKSGIKNFFERSIKYIGMTKEDARSLFTKENFGTFIFRHKNTTYIASFAAIYNDRYVITTVPLNVLMLHIDKLLSGLILIVVITCGLLLGLLYYSNKLFRQHEKIIYDIAFVDKVTESDNKNKFSIQAREILDKNPNKTYSMISVEITKFKALNELFGVENANKILKDFSEMIKSNLSNDDICTRDHASTFVILHEYKNEDFIVKYFIEKIIDDINNYNKDSMKKLSKNAGVLLNAKLVPVFGVYLINDRSDSIDQMCERANVAKLNVKDDVKNVCRFYDDNLRMQILQEKTIEDEMYGALLDNQFHMYLQPKFDLQTKELVGAEALVRWIHPKKGLVPPMQFIPLFEKNGFVTEIDKCIWKQASEFLSTIQKEGKKLFPISVNVSRIHMDTDKFIDELILLTTKYGIDPKYLELELTESACFNNEKRFMEAVTNLKKLGFVVTMDDFGTGYSSLNMLRNLPIDVLKLDRGFIKDTIQDGKGQIVTKSIIEMANKLNMLTVAEGVETEEQAEFLRNIGCKIAQGFLYGKPVDIGAFREQFIKNVIY